MEIPFVGGAYQGRSLNINSQVCQNLYPVMDQQGGKKVLALMNTPGLSLFSNPTDVGAVRGLEVMGGYLYAVIGSALYKIDTSGAFVVMTGNLISFTGRVWMSNNGTQLMITDGTYGYILAGNVLSRIADTDFPTPSSLTFQDGYFIISSKDTGRFYISDSYDGTAWDALDYATAEGDPDELQAVISAHRELWLLGKISYEVWYNSGDATFPFDRIPGAVNRVGCVAPFSAAEHQGVIAWLDDTRCVQASSSGYQVGKISTSQIEYQFAQYGTVSDAIGFFYSQEGHVFYVLTFPTEQKTWVYDSVTQMWHTRASGPNDTRHPANCYALFKGMPIVGDYDSGKLYKYDLAKYSDNGKMVRRIRSCPAISSDRKRITHHSLEIEFEPGVGLEVNEPTLGTGTDPKAMLQFSNDDGHTWGNELWADIGKIGKYKTRVVWRRLGTARDRVYKVTITDPVKIVILGAHLEAEALSA
jgi:hypothetical protein